ncbi:putative RAMP superfamily protein probably involved in DNA repair [Rivularia sp. PCC 7116]|uniref:RAMP superfamily CRISPR-associated protein n=1 Tax=Rivularia sp. PCC 7116 TaxID=373994 RepID=UPI00029F0EFF|nr:RAMP superfamily CRISPR-associated protein [Rivularia sp. PCC 7116]AFY55875.1 putative RAMP superfamily protein probably involved in DNA repair [Rivularia sp. PCC 7116]
MHKRFVNHCTIELSLIPQGAILIKSGQEDINPSKPKMEFVQTFHSGGSSIYLPGSSLKGAIRSHAERIVRTVGSDKRPTDSDSNQLWANDPLNDKYEYLKDQNNKDLPATEIYKKSSFTDQIFGNTSIASRIRIEDAYPQDKTKLKIEQRHGVAIDRVFGSVAVGPFDYEVCTSGEFHTKIHLKNFSLAQLGLVGLVLRDLNEGWFAIGFAKSRGLGNVKINYHKAVVQYPGCKLEDNQIKAFGKQQTWSNTALLGAGEFLQGENENPYNFPFPDIQNTSIEAEKMELNFGTQLIWNNEGEKTVSNLFELAVNEWSKLLTEGAAA